MKSNICASAGSIGNSNVRWRWQNRAALRILSVVGFSLAFATAYGADAKKSPKAAPSTTTTPKVAKAIKLPPKEQLTCRTGPTDRQARLTVVVVKGRPMEFAYYSRLGTRVCSIHGWRGDAYTKWEDAGGRARVKLLDGSAELEYQPGHLKLTFSDVGRMQYCGMYGELNGVVEVSSNKNECGLEGVFD